MGCDPIIGPPPMEHGARHNVGFDDIRGDGAGSGGCVMGCVTLVFRLRSAPFLRVISGNRRWPMHPEPMSSDGRVLAGCTPPRAPRAPPGASVLHMTSGRKRNRYVVCTMKNNRTTERRGSGPREFRVTPSRLTHKSRTHTLHEARAMAERPRHSKYSIP